MLPIAAGIGIAAASTAINQGLATYSADRQNQMSRDNMVLANQMSRENLLDSASMRVDSLKRAGLSPLHDGEFTPAAAPAAASAPDIKMPQFDAMQSAAMLANIENMQAQNENIDAQTAKIQAETKNIQQTTGIVSEQDAAANDAFSRSVDRLLEVYPNNSGLRSLRENLKNGSIRGLGSIRAEVEAISFERAMSSQFKYDVEDALDNAVGADKLQNGAAAFISELPRVQYKMAAQLLTNSIQTLKLLQAQTDNTSETTKKISQEVENLEKQSREIEAHITQMVSQGKLNEAQANKIKNNDITTLIRNEDYKGAGIASIGNIGELIGTIIKVIMKK